MLPFLRQSHITDDQSYIIHCATKKPECNDVPVIFTFDDICYLKSYIRMNTFLAIFSCLNGSYGAFKNKLRLLEHFIHCDFTYTCCIPITSDLLFSPFQSPGDGIDVLDDLLSPPFKQLFKGDQVGNPVDWPARLG